MTSPVGNTCVNPANHKPICVNQNKFCFIQIEIMVIQINTTDPL